MVLKRKIINIEECQKYLKDVGQTIRLITKQVWILDWNKTNKQILNLGQLSMQPYIFQMNQMQIT